MKTSFLEGERKNRRGVGVINIIEKEEEVNQEKYQ